LLQNQYVVIQEIIQLMPHSFLAFIDESGDDGFGNYREPGKSGGASHWLVLSAGHLQKPLGKSGFN
jgi:hypothetical protein